MSSSRFCKHYSILLFPDPILSSADVVQHILDFVVAKLLPRVVLEDSIVYVSRIIAHLASILLLLLASPNCLADLRELSLLTGKIETTVPSVFEKIAHLFLLRATIVRLTFVLSKHDNIFDSQTRRVDQWQREFSLLKKQSTSSPSARTFSALVLVV